MAGVAAAWRLSEPGWQERFESITLYQRGWRLGGKGASGRGPHGRVEEHGLHLWFGSYQNAFALLRQCYEELDRPRTDPGAPIKTWSDALFPAGVLGLEEHDGEGWQHWIGRFSGDDREPGDPDDGRELTVVEFVQRALALVADFIASLPGGDASFAGVAVGLTSLAVAATYETSRLLAEGMVLGQAVRELQEAVNAAIDDVVTRDPTLKRTWHLLSIMVATVRGILADRLMTDPRGFRAINDEDFVEWIRRHGVAPAVAEFSFIRGLYDLVFGYENGDPKRPAFSAGLAVFLTGRMLFDYRGAVFWKMAAGMGDVVFAPLYQTLVDRGVGFEFFHRVDRLHVGASGNTVDAVSVTRQAHLRHSTYDPLIEVKGLPCFPSSPLVDQLAEGTDVEMVSFESEFGCQAEAETRFLRRGDDFDVVVLAISHGALRSVAAELVEERAEWRRMIEGVKTVGTQSLQLWIRPSEPELGFEWPGATVSGYVEPFNTWASMPQLIEAEDWSAAIGPGTIAYFCGCREEIDPEAADDAVKRDAQVFVEQHLGGLLPGVMGPDGVRWELFCGSGERRGAEVLETQYWRANVDGSDRYVQSLPGTDHLRLRADESGYDNLVLAGDWIDSGLNAGFIEAAVLSGLEAANAVQGRHRLHRIAGLVLP
jgi:uncharacterized protein with NAD-binding domain and iron-sulfur cluster